jgi:excisionase family DNA binding protein
MENPFEIILNRLDRIETLIHSINVSGGTNSVIAHKVLNIKQLSEFIGISQSAIYKKTSDRTIPHYKNGKKLYFNYEEIENWLLTTKISTVQEIEDMANAYVSKRKLKFK